MTTLAAATAHALRTQGPVILDAPKRFVGFVIDFIDPESPEARVLYQVINGRFLPIIASAPTTQKGLVEAAMHAADDLNYERMVDLAAARSVALQVAEGIASYHGFTLMRQNQGTRAAERDSQAASQPAAAGASRASHAGQQTSGNAAARNAGQRVAGAGIAGASHYTVAEAMARMRQSQGRVDKPQQQQAATAPGRHAAVQPAASNAQPASTASSHSSSSHYTVAEAMAKMRGGQQATAASTAGQPRHASGSTPPAQKPASTSFSPSSSSSSNSSHYTVAEAMARMKSQQNR